MKIPTFNFPNLDLITILRLLQTLFSLLSLILNAVVTNFFNTHTLIGQPPSYLVFLLFTSTFTLLISIPYTTFAPRYFRASINRYLSLSVELLTTLFWFAGTVSGAVYLSKLAFCAGSICTNARAGVAFAALTFLCYCVTSYFPIKYCFFDGDEKFEGAGEGMGLSGAERITRARLRRDEANNLRIRNEREGIVDTSSKWVGVRE